MTKKDNEVFETEIKAAFNKKELRKYLNSPLPYKIRPNFNNSTNRYKSKNKDYGKFGNIKKAKNSNHIASSQQKRRTPKIKTKYDSILERLTTNISLLKGDYKNILKEKYNYNEHIIYQKRRNLVEEGKENKIKMKSKIEQYKNIKKIEQNKEREKNMKMKEEYDKNKHMKLNSIKKEVEQMKIKEKNNFKLYEDNLKEIRNKKIKIKEEEKEYIKKELSEQKDRYKKDIELRKRINKEKEIKNAERRDGYRIYILRQMENDLRNKLKIEYSLNKEFLNKYNNNFHVIVNKDTNVDIYSN
jgi:hypothetical protein